MGLLEALELRQRDSLRAPELIAGLLLLSRNSLAVWESRSAWTVRKEGGTIKKRKGGKAGNRTERSEKRTLLGEGRDEACDLAVDSLHAHVPKTRLEAVLLAR